jgi:phosphosulfolactate synthase (CoM biosynthesis protein A)
MNWKHLSLVVVGTTVFVSGQAFTQEVYLPGRVLQKTAMKTQNQFLALSSVAQDAFTPTTVTCPGSGTCTLHIEVSTGFISLSSGEQLNIIVKVDGTGIGVLPSSRVVVAAVANSTAAYGTESRTFQWIRTNIPAGNHTVDVEMVVAGGGFAATATSRTLKINIYKP